MKDTKKKISSGPNKGFTERRRRKRRKIYRIFQIGTISQWILTSFFLVMLPLIFTVFHSNESIKKYTDKGAHLFLTIGANNNTRVLVEYLQDMDRSIQQYQITEAVDYFKVFQDRHDKFVGVAKRTGFFILPDKLQVMFFRLTYNELELYNQILIIKNADEKSLTIDDIKRYSQLRSDANKLLDQGNKQISIEITYLSLLAEEVKTKMVQYALIAGLTAVVLCLSLFYLINKPIKRIEKAIHRLGNAQFNKRIYIPGPKDLRAVGERLEWLRQRQNQLENSKQFFIKTISHELKTPLATLIEGAGLLQDEVVGELNAEQHNIIELLQIANIRLNGLIENLIEYQKCTSSLVKMNYSDCKLHQLINQICAEYQLLLDSKNVSVELTANPVDFEADRDKMRIIISNLFSNALKFSPDGGQINIKLELISGNINLLIADQGPGIEQEQLADVFTEFYRQETPEDWKIKGSGLGLSLVKVYVAAHNGRIELLPPDTQYCGARFLVIIPLKPKETTNQH